jgi:peptide/nickel transport system substrate-binding protein
VKSPLPNRSAALVVPVIAFAVMVAACSPRDDATTPPTTTVLPTTEAAAPTTTVAATTTTELDAGRPYGGSAVAVSAQEPATLNPFVTGGDNAIVGEIGQSYLVGVYDIDGSTMELIPELVTELPTIGNGGVVINADGSMTVRYEIKEEAVWEDGTPISGDDFEFTYGIIMDPDLPTFKLTYEDIIPESVIAGPKTFEYTLAEATLRHETLFDTIIPKHAVEGTNFVTDWNTAMWPSGGPFRFEEWLTGESITVVRNDSFWGRDAVTDQELPYLESVTWQFIPETASMMEGFADREFDVIQPTANAEIVDALQALEPEGAVVEVLSGTTWEHLNWQFGPGVVERNPDSCNALYEMRLAATQAVDKQRIVDEVTSGAMSPLNSYVEVFAPDLATDAWAQYSYDPAAAAESYARAVELAGRECSVVFTTTSNDDTRVQVSELLSDMFGEAGIPYENVLEDSQLYFGETLDGGFWDMGQWAWTSAPGFASLVGLHDLWDPEAPPPEGLNYYEWGTPASTVRDESTTVYAELRDAMNSTVDVEELSTMIQTAEGILADNLVFLPLYASESVAAVWADTLGGFKHNPTTGYYTWNIGEWHRLDG